MAHSSKRRGVGNIPKPLAGGHELQLTHQEPSGSGKYHRALRRLEHTVVQKKVKRIKNWLKNQILLYKDQKNELKIPPALKKEGPVVSTISKQLQKCPKTIPKDLRRSREVPRTIKEREKVKPIGTDLTHRGTRYPNWSLPQWTMSSIWPGLLWNSQPSSSIG
ncbi:hypothetical protein O181_010888 [Austropuccinia psidii MF-1]|uniref:Uncharacterized protein n=1 Tax=Austropuccinia psidii MF-1 TaxID=1389203 RepID=A0A9Q3GKT7_9BASI|nr:hypothetical protein [Austropuccinia psidii MF-1]